MFVCDIGSNSHDDQSFGNVADIVETRLPMRLTPLHYGVKYHEDPLSFTLIFGSECYMDRYQLQEVSNWLTGYQQYQWLSIDQPDMEHIQFHCLIQELTPISVGWFPVAFEAKIICDGSYGYSYPFSFSIPISGVTNYRFYNDSTIRENLPPDMTIALASGCSSFSVTNQTTGKVTKFTGLPSGGITIIMDNENEILHDSYDQYDLYDYFNFQFFELASGDNELTFTGTGTVTISGRYRYNVGA